MATKEEKAQAAAAVASRTVTPEEAFNLLVLLNRVTVTGNSEVMTTAILTQKLRNIQGDFTGEQPSG
jgi:hypothetical protein